MLNHILRIINYQINTSIGIVFTPSSNLEFIRHSEFELSSNEIVAIFNYDCLIIII